MLDPSSVWPDYPVINDPARPVWHFGPPAQWMNDPHGTLWHDGWYHVFYQHNPGGEEWGDLHWGHGRSRDLVHWEHLPLALFPQHTLGEKHCYSGCAALDASGTPQILYTSVMHDEAHPGAQVLASPRDPGLIAWTQDVAAPVIDLKSHGGPAFERGWRDPFVFRTEGRTFLVLGSWLGEESVIALYENPDDNLRQWVYRGIILRAPKAQTVFFECPNLFKLGKKWVLLTSPVREVEWCTGMLDLATYTFQVERRGRVDESDSFYAPHPMVDPTGRTLLFGWVQRFPKNRHWQGRLTAPRRIWLDDAGDLCAAPAAELAILRSGEKPFPAQTLGSTPTPLALPGDHLHEVELTLEREPSATIRCEIAGVTISIGPGGVSFSGVAPAPPPVTQHSPQPPGSGDPRSAATSPIRLHWLLDRSLIEIFVNGRAVYTRVVEFPSDPVAQLSADGPARLLIGRAWALRAAPPTLGFTPAS